MTDTREHLIQKTCELIELQGYHATGLNQIIRESGSPKGSLYYHFPGGKEELAAKAIKSVGAKVLERIQDNLMQTGPPADVIRQFIKNIAWNVERSDFSAGGPITTIAMETASTSEALRTICAEIYAGWQNAFAIKLRQGGFSEARSESISRLIIAAIEGGVILCRTTRSRQPLEEVANEIGSLIANST